MNAIEPLQHFHNLVVFGCSYWLAAEETILGYRSPCHARCLGRRDCRKGLILSQEGEKIEVIICGIGTTGEVRGRGRDYASVLRIGWWEIGEVQRWCCYCLIAFGGGHAALLWKKKYPAMASGTLVI